MKKLFIILLALSLSLSLFGCKDKEEESVLPPGAGAQSGYEQLFPEENGTQEESKEEEEEIVLPAPPENADFYRGTWISGGEANINSPLDSYYGNQFNYMTLSPDGTGSLVLGGEYQGILYELQGSTLKFTLSQTGERFLGSVLSDKITEINYMNSGKLMTFIKIGHEDAERVIKDLGLGD